MVHIVLFEVEPHPDHFDAYLSHAKALKPELERTPGFIENIRYKSMTRMGKILSLSTWETEKALVRWRTHAPHHAVQEKGREGILEDYTLRVGEVIASYDGYLPSAYLGGQNSREDPDAWTKPDYTETGAGEAVVLVNTKRSMNWLKSRRQWPERIAEDMGLYGCEDVVVQWDVFEAVLTPGDLILMITLKEGDATSYQINIAWPGKDVRCVKVLREYGKYDRREAPQYFPDAAGKETQHAM